MGAFEDLIDLSNKCARGEITHGQFKVQSKGKMKIAKEQLKEMRNLIKEATKKVKKMEDETSERR